MKLTGNNLVIVNILATYVRIVLSAGLMLFSTRWVLQALGKEDFGLYSVVGGLIVFIMFIGGTMSSSVQRFYAYSIGQGNPEEVKRWFNTAFISLTLFSILLVVVGVPVGHYLISSVMTIPLERIQTSLWVYNLSIVGAVGTLVTVPYLGMLIAAQRIFEVSLWGLLSFSLSFCLAWYLLSASGDLLLTYALGMVGIKLILDIIQVVRAQWLFKACHLKLSYWFNKKQVKELFSFVGWDLFGGMGYMVRNQGTALLINLFLGPTVNASYGIANQIAGQTNSITAALTGAISPEITTREGAGNRDRMISLSLRTSKFAVLLTYLWLIPLYIGIDYVLALWLTDVPEYAGIFCRVILIIYAISNLTTGLGSAVLAAGKVKEYQRFQGVVLMLTFPLMWIVYRLGGSPVQAILVMLVTGVIHTLGRVYWAEELLNLAYSRWIKEVFIKSMVVLIFPVLLTVILKQLISPSFKFLILLTIFNFFCVCVFSWFIALDRPEKEFIKLKISNLFKLLKNI